jgi:hypothetical protein
MINHQLKAAPERLNIIECPGDLVESDTHIDTPSVTEVSHILPEVPSDEEPHGSIPENQDMEKRISENHPDLTTFVEAPLKTPGVCHKF